MPDPLGWRYANEGDLGLLADWNHQNIRDSGHRNPMAVPQLEERMRRWLQGEYQAVIFTAGEAVAYALFCREGGAIYLRQFFVRRDRRRSGIGRAAIALLRREIWPKDVRLTVSALGANPGSVAFYRSVGYRDYSVTLEILPP